MEISTDVIQDALLLVIVLVVYAIFAKPLARIWISAAFFFTLVGMLLGPSASAVFSSKPGTSAVELLASIALATVLFGDASRVQLSALRVNLAAPVRLLTIGLLGTVLLGMVIAYLLIGGIGWPIAMVIAVMLAPTDAALGAPVVENEVVPAKVRSSLFVESGLNDGLAVPLLVVALAWSGLEDAGTPFLQVLFLKVVVSTVLGIAIALVAYLALLVARRIGGFDRTWSSLVPLLTAIATYLITEHLGGSGFIAAFVGGVAFGQVMRARADRGIEVDEAVSSLLQGSTWFIFGALAAGPYLLGGAVQWTWLLYAVLSLTVIRMVPVALALLGLREPPGAVLFMGWFGPRGLASVVFLMLVLGTNPEDEIAHTIGGIVTITVLLSVVLHGLTATPIAARFGTRATDYGRLGRSARG